MSEAHDKDADSRETLDLRERHPVSPSDDLDDRTRSAGLVASSTGEGPAGPDGPGSVVDRYLLIEEIGEGGFGSVYRAEQREPVVRPVALKILKRGMDTRQVIARFGQERQALATMDHPHIAKVLDAGTTASGLPYFAMELVQGERITRFCDERELTVPQRLDLFLQVASAIQHAHLKGIVHRDIKPSNVLAAMREDGPHATVIDFGIAKAIEEPLHGEAPRTRLGQIIGTPLYMSPEQSEGSAAVDNRTDVYSLGALLYELLTGGPPIDTTALDETPRPAADLQRIIREFDPPRPSTRVSSSKTPGELAARRATEPGRLRSLLRGELDWIVMRALEKDPDRRYQTVNAFALDVQNHLAGRPVVAAPPSAVYRTRKFVARNRGAVIAAAVLVSALVVGLGGTIWQARVAARERDAAREEAARANALNDFMTRMLTASDPESLGARDVTVLELLDRASQTVDETLEGAAEVQARTLLGNSLRSLGKAEKGRAELERAVELSTGEAGLVRAMAVRALGSAFYDENDFERAIPRFEEAVAELEALRDSGDESFGAYQLRDLAVFYGDIANGQQRLGRFEEAERSLDRSAQLMAELPQRDLVQLGRIASMRGDLAAGWKGDPDTAVRFLREALRLHREADQPYLVADTLNGLASHLMFAGELEESRRLFEESLQITREVWGDRSPRTAIVLENLGNVHSRMGNYDRVTELLEEVLSIRVEVFGNNAAVYMTKHNIGYNKLMGGDAAGGLAMIEESLGGLREIYPESNEVILSALLNRGRCHLALDDLGAAQLDFEEASGIVEALDLAPTARLRLNTDFEMSRTLCRRGATARGRSLAQSALDRLDPETLGHPALIERFEKQISECRAD